MDFSTKLSRRQVLKLAAAISLSAGAKLTFDGLIPTQTLGNVFSYLGETEDYVPKWTMVIDLRRCDGCDYCVEGCRTEHNLLEHQSGIKVYKLSNASGQPYFFPVPCMQCADPPCTKVCPVHATYQREDGVVVQNQDKCIGCRMCMAACPYDARFFNWESPLQIKPQSEAPQQLVGTVGKCQFCAHLLAKGDLPACVAGCSGHHSDKGAIYFGDAKADLATNGNEIIGLSKFLKDNDAIRFQEELGTEPRVYYILGHGQEFSH